jgi:diguanylate cyclase (GGDEF)-like protein/PAS domain S-box-containing protein
VTFSATDRSPPERVPERFSTALALSEGRVSLLVEPDGVIVHSTPSVRRLLGYDPEDLIGTILFDLYDESQARYSRIGFQKIREQPELDADDLGIVPRTARIRRRDGTWLSVDSFASPMLRLGEVNGVLIEWFPVSDPGCLITAIDSLAQGLPPRETLTAAVRLTESLISGLSGGIVTVLEGLWTPVIVPSGCAPDGLTAALPAPSDSRWDGPWIRFPDEEARPWVGRGRSAAAIPLHASNGELLGTYVACRPRLDTTLSVISCSESLFGVALRMAALTLNQNIVHDALRQAAELDGLTGLLNRTGLERRFSELSTRSDVTDIAVIAIDLDDFKPVNDTFGHAAGDEILIATAEALRGCSRPSDLIGRLGGDEFVVIASMTSSPVLDAAKRFATRLHHELNGPRELRGSPDTGVLTVRVGASTGLSCGPITDLPRLLQEADQALYTAKRKGKGSLAVA